MNQYTFRVMTESMVEDEGWYEKDVTILDVTPHEAWKQLFVTFAALEENDSVILSITLWETLMG